MERNGGEPFFFTNTKLRTSIDGRYDGSAHTSLEPPARYSTPHAIISRWARGGVRGIALERARGSSSAGLLRVWRERGSRPQSTPAPHGSSHNCKAQSAVQPVARARIVAAAAHGKGGSTHGSMLCGAAAQQGAQRHGAAA